MAPSQSILHCRYGYDPLDRLISQFLAGAPEHQRFYCKSRLSTEIQGAIGYSIFQKEDLLLAQQKRQNDAIESTLLATDLKRSILQTLEANLQHTIAYSPYGHRRAESGLSSLLGFNGERADPATGHYLLGNGHRGFNPVLMRFNSPDKWSPFGEGGLNPYSYCLGDPINKNDPTGRVPNFALARYHPTPHTPNRYSFVETDKQFFQLTYPARGSSKDYPRTLNLTKKLTFRQKLTLEAHKKPDLVFPKTEPDSLFSQAGRQFTGEELIKLQTTGDLPKDLVRKFDHLHGNVNYIKDRYPHGPWNISERRKREEQLLNGKVPGVIPARAAKILAKQIKLFRKGDIADNPSIFFGDSYLEKYEKVIKDHQEF
ncbi:RHS repeat-associated core domain-containing protein [Pseudomonas sp. MAG733B]|uniref:RHS repeat-associated core domain-containing protein n=1 Tax=Pseudomonas sp. MAG733B TaxID=3122079 RepID=UPI0030CFC9AB